MKTLYVASFIIAFGADYEGAHSEIVGAFQDENKAMDTVWKKAKEYYDDNINPDDVPNVEIGDWDELYDWNTNQHAGYERYINCGEDSNLFTDGIDDNTWDILKVVVKKCQVK